MSTTLIDLERHLAIAKLSREMADTKVDQIHAQSDTEKAAYAEHMALLDYLLKRLVAEAA